MTDKIHSLTVVLDKDYREDDVQNIIDAISMIKGVISVDANVSDLDTWTAEKRAIHDLGMKIIEVIQDFKS